MSLDTRQQLTTQRNRALVAFMQDIGNEEQLKRQALLKSMQQGSCVTSVGKARVLSQKDEEENDFFCKLYHRAQIRRYLRTPHSQNVSKTLRVIESEKKAAAADLSQPVSLASSSLHFVSFKNQQVKEHSSEFKPMPSILTRKSKKSNIQPTHLNKYQQQIVTPERKRTTHGKRSIVVNTHRTKKESSHRMTDGDDDEDPPQIPSMSPHTNRSPKQVFQMRQLGVSVLSLQQIPQDKSEFMHEISLLQKTEDIPVTQFQQQRKQQHLLSPLLLQKQQLHSQLVANQSRWIEAYSVPDNLMQRTQRQRSDSADRGSRHGGSALFEKLSSTAVVSETFSGSPRSWKEQNGHVVKSSLKMLSKKLSASSVMH